MASFLNLHLILIAIYCCCVIKVCIRAWCLTEKAAAHQKTRVPKNYHHNNTTKTLKIIAT
jgi:hypothetical protein